MILRPTRIPRLLRGALALAMFLAVSGTHAAHAAEPSPGTPLTIRRIASPIVVDGDLSDAGWQGVEGITTWYETRIGDNVEPQVGNVAYLAYDDKFIYAGFRFSDPDPRAIRAPLGDHDAMPSATDYAGVIVDSRNDGKSAQMFLANARGVQYDAITNDASGEDNSPDYFWDSVGKITPSGWELEIRIPFSSLRYAENAQPTWGMLLYRNYPRDRRYQFFSTRLPRDVNCFICNSSKMTGLEGLPRGSHLVVAPFATASQSSAPEAGLGSRPKAGEADTDGGLDVKWNPSAGVAIDGTLNPDFSQVESDAAQIVANERFALFFPEKRPFFLEGVDLFSTPLQAVYTRTITAPRGGLRATGKLGSTAYTALVTQDRGGGVAILPGPQGSSDALQDFVSDVGVLRLRHDLGGSFVSALVTGRDLHGDAGGQNLVFGPDFSWRPRPSDSFTGQFLLSESRTPRRTDLAGEWDGRTLSDHAAMATWSHSTPHHNWYVQGQDIGEDFRADNGFIPQVGFREAYLDAGATFRPKERFLSRIRVFTVNYVDAELDGDVLNQRWSVGTGMDGKWNSFTRVELNRDEIRVGNQLLQRFRPRFYLEAGPGRVLNRDEIRVGNQLLQRFRPRFYLETGPGRVLNYVSIDAYLGDEIDFANGREGSGTTVALTASIRPNDHLELRANASRRAVHVDGEGGGTARLFLAQVERLRATWAFDSRSFLRLIGQYVETTRDPSLYSFAVGKKSAGFSSSALFAYKLNWQTVLYAGYGDERTFSAASENLERGGTQAFAKVSYAWQQ